MNERIKELAEQATSIVEMVGPQGYTSSYANFDREKFAELIVQECADIIQRESDKAIRNNTYMGDDVPASVTQWAIKKHFGVE
jgi:hypothetical protein